MTVHDTIVRTLDTKPGIRERLDRVHDAAWRSVDPVVLELCRLRIAALLGCRAAQDERTPAAVAAGLDEDAVRELPRWPSSPRFGARERACLAFCEHFVIDVASMPDELATDLCSHLGNEGVRSFATALLVIEQRQRLALAWERLFSREIES